MFKIQITKPEITERKGVGKDSGKPYHLRIQQGHLFGVDAQGVEAEFPDKFEILLDADQAPFPRGTYTLHPSAVYVSRDGRLSIAPRLAPVPAGK